MFIPLHEQLMLLQIHAPGVCVLLYFPSLETVFEGCDVGPRASIAKSLLWLDVTITMESLPTPAPFLEAGWTLDLTPSLVKVKMVSNVQQCS